MGFYHLLYARHTKHRRLRLILPWVLAAALVWFWYHPTASHAVTYLVLFAAAAFLLAGWTGRKRDHRKVHNASH